VDRETRGGDPELRARGEGAFQVVAQELGDVVEELQFRSLESFLLAEKDKN
jgi:hypothetical protein